MRSLRRRRPAGFTLTEVLIGLGLAALVLGIVLQSTSRDVLSVTQCGPRYQALLRASQVLEYRMEEDRQGEDDRGSVGEKFPYDLSTKPVVTDPRVEQVEVAVSYSHRRQTVSAYRLRIRRQEQAPQANPTLPEAPPAPNPAPALPPASGAFPTGP